MTDHDELTGAITLAKSRIDKLKEERKHIGEKIRAEITDLAENYGLSKHAIKLAFDYADMKEGKREGLDTAYHTIREALDMPLQLDLFGQMPPPRTNKRQKARVN